MDTTQLNELARHITANYSLDTIIMKTRCDREEDGEQFTPLDPAELLEVHEELQRCRAEADETNLITPEQRLIETLDEDGGEVYIKVAAATPADWENALMVTAAEVSALQDATQDAIERFVSIARQADAAKETSK